MNHLMNQEFVVVDVETTGLSPRDGDRIIEIAAIKIQNLEVVNRFVSFIDPGRELSFGAYLVNHITPEMIKGAPKAQEILPDFLKFAGAACLIGHNIKFDLKFLNHELMASGLSTLESFEVIDTLKMARGLHPQLMSYSLANVAYELGIRDQQQHRALSDVEMTFSVFRQLLLTAEKRGMNTMETLTKLFGIGKKDKRKDQLKVAMINKAISDRVDLHVLYSGVNSGATVRKVTPKGLVKEGRDHMLVGFCHLRNEERSFRIDRIIKLEEVR